MLADTIPSMPDYWPAYRPSHRPPSRAWNTYASATESSSAVPVTQMMAEPLCIYLVPSRGAGGSSTCFPSLRRALLFFLAILTIRVNLSASSPPASDLARKIFTKVTSRIKILIDAQSMTDNACQGRSSRYRGCVLKVLKGGSSGVCGKMIS